jgi:hypothetical protein
MTGVDDEESRLRALIHAFGASGQIATSLWGQSGPLGCANLHCMSA